MNKPVLLKRFGDYPGKAIQVTKRNGVSAVPRELPDPAMREQIRPSHPIDPTHHILEDAFREPGKT